MSTNSDYKRVWMKNHRALVTWRKEIARGHCPVCGMLLTSTYHFNCRYLDKEDQSTPF